MKFYIARTVVLALCLALSGCDSTRFLYNRAHWLLSYQTDRYLDLDQAQAARVDQKLSDWLNWHRHTQLICYAELIREFETRAHTTLTHADIVWLESELKRYYEAAIFSATPQIAQVLGDLDADQIDHLEKRLAKDHAKLARQMKAGEERRLTRRAKKTVGGLKKWFGHLSRTQIAWIEQHSLALPDTYAPWLEYRAQRDSTFINMLRANTDTQSIADTIKVLWTGENSPAADKLDAQMANLMSQSKKLAIDFYAMASTEQKVHFWRRLNDYRSDFLQLANVDTIDAACELPVMRLTDEPTGNDSTADKIAATGEV